MIVKAIPTNIITGFLGVGKTSLIKQLLAAKPEGETWAILVNEFGEVGIDAGLMDANNKGVQIREVAGGCMCCAAGVPTQVAINQLISRAKPDRLLIEPTGLGHPNEIIKLLSAPHYQNVIDLKGTFCLVDLRKLTDSRYLEHALFRLQLLVADIIVATKSDLYPEFEAQCTVVLDDALACFLEQIGQADAQVLRHSNLVSIQDDNNELVKLLNHPRINKRRTHTPITQQSSVLLPGINRIEQQGIFTAIRSEKPLAFDERGIVRKLNQSDGFFSCGWVFQPKLEFDFDALMTLIKRLETQKLVAGLLRLKAVMITTDGIAGINWIDGEMSVSELEDCMDSRIEMISMHEPNVGPLEQALLSCLVA
ncbi:CobW family GTP-binding protein [Shewanella acanthi]|uniref:CobW family GTP-binding protein n=1 Tax=Shewanella acanthi TaxID=2864212 RepID=UPI001C6576CC|nr:CobW family GTP-binding protein [Shewanella acanthi]QYJ77888.1 GTP-binding protein [Shewanella acanthi]